MTVTVPSPQRLAEGLQSVAMELGQLDEEEDPVVGEAGLSRARDATATYEPDDPDAMGQRAQDDSIE